MSKRKGRNSIQNNSSKSGITDAVLEKCKAEQESIKALVAHLSLDREYGADEVVRAIKLLEDNHLVSIKARAPYKKFLSYALSPLSIWFWATCLVVAISVILSFISAGVVLYIRYALGAALVLFLPGYSLIGLLYYKRSDINELARYALSFAASLAVVPLIGLILNYTPAGLTLINIELALALFVVLTSAWALWRKYSAYRLELLTGV